MRRYLVGVPIVALIYGISVFAVTIAAVGRLNPDAAPRSPDERAFLLACCEIVRFPFCYAAEWRPIHMFFASGGSDPDSLWLFVLNGIVWGIVVIAAWHLTFKMRRKNRTR